MWQRGQHLTTGRILGAAASLLLLIIATGATAADTPEQTLTNLARELSMTIDAVVASAEKAEPQNTALQQRMRDAALAQMKGLRSMANEYQQKVGSSESIADTELFFENLRSAVNSALATARDAVPDPGVARGLTRLDEIMASLGSLYAKND